MRLEALQPIRVRHAHGETLVAQGERFSSPDEEARALVRNAPHLVKVIAEEPVTIEPAQRPDGSPLSAIYWESGAGQILGPAVPEFLAREKEAFWIVTTLQGQTRWINADCLRSKKAFERQRLGRVIN
jgi:hypothetical protein